MKVGDIVIGSNYVCLRTQLIGIGISTDAQSQRGQ
jgi:hypothetical protein